jgi:hypothetical protein
MALMVLLVGIPGMCPAVTTIGENDEMQLAGKLQTRFTFATEDRGGFTSPQVEAGDMLQHRNLAYLELKHLINENLNYRLVGRGLYEGVYEYGPQEFQDVRNANEKVIDDFSRDIDLWEGYADIALNRMFLRVGKQIISWGETDLFPMLDRINPLDDTYGGIFEDLDDRRLPLWMVKGIYDLGQIGLVNSLSLEGFFNPGFIDQEVSPLAPAGTPYAFPFPESPFATRLIEPQDSIDDSRWGLRLQGVIGENFNFSLAHYKTFLNTPAVRLAFDPGFVPVQELVYEDVQITGGSLSFFEPLSESVLRLEVAYHWDEPVFIPGVNLDAPTALANGRADIPERDVLRFAVAADKNVWIRALNKDTMFNFTLQYSGEYIMDYDERLRQAVPVFPDGRFADLEEYEHKLVFLCYTGYLNGKLTPQLSAAWDPRGAYLLLPQVSTMYEPWRFTLQYAVVDGDEDVSFGFLRDRDQVSLSISLVF